MEALPKCICTLSYFLATEGYSRISQTLSPLDPSTSTYVADICATVKEAGKPEQGTCSALVSKSAALEMYHRRHFPCRVVRAEIHSFPGWFVCRSRPPVGLSFTAFLSPPKAFQVPGTPALVGDAQQAEHNVGLSCLGRRREKRKDLYHCTSFLLKTRHLTLFTDPTDTDRCTIHVLASASLPPSFLRGGGMSLFVT